MTNEELVSRIQAGETARIATLWEQVNSYTSKRATAFFYRNYERCVKIGIELDDLKQEAYLGIYIAIQKYEADGGAKFLSYAEYHLKSRFYSAVKYRGAQCCSETSIDTILIKNVDGTLANLSDVLIDPDAERGVYGFIEHEYQKDYQARLEKAIRNTMRCLLKNQRETVLACFGRGISFADYAKQKGISKQSVHETGKRAMKKLRANNSALTTFLSEA